MAHEEKTIPESMLLEVKREKASWMNQTKKRFVELEERKH
jgi:hypothetical protein